MPRKLFFMLDETCVDWYDYHFQDTILRNDIVWRTWRSTVQKYLNHEQLTGRACAICGTTASGAVCAEYVGGYRLVTCPRRCQTPSEQSMHKTIDAYTE